MPSVKDLGKRLKSVTSTSKITKAMKMVAASKLRQAETTMNAARPFALSVQDLMLPHIGMKGDDKPENVLTLAISSDKGLCGGINSRVVKESKLSMAALQEQGASPEVHAAAQHAYLRTRALSVKGVSMRGQLAWIHTSRSPLATPPPHPPHPPHPVNKGSKPTLEWDAASQP